MSGKAIAGQDKRAIASTTEELCKKACEDEDSFDCRSVDFYVSTGKCYLQEADRHSARLGSYANYIYMERDCSGRSKYFRNLL